MQKRKLVVLTVLTVALMLAWAVPAIADSHMQKVNINTATLKKLMTLDGIGEKYAQRIINFREKKGSFQKPQDLMKVKGIGRKIVDKNIDRISVQDE